MNFNRAFNPQSCPYCKSTQTNRYFQIENDTVRHCSSCNLIFRPKRNSDDAIIDYYRKNYYREWGQDQAGHKRQNIYLDALQTLEKYVGRGLLLDIGAGSGTLLAIARDRGWKTMGQEISLGSCYVAEQKYGLKLRNENLREMVWEVNYFDAITMINVLDHLPDPWWVLRRAFNALKEGGIIYLRIPNGYIHSSFYRISNNIPSARLREKIRKLLVLHLYHLTPQFIKRVLKDAGFKSAIIRGSIVSQGVPENSFSKHEMFWLALMKKYYPVLSSLAEKITGGGLIVSPSINIYALKK